MTRKIALSVLSLLCNIALLAQTGGVKGTVINRTDRSPVTGATLTLYSGAAWVRTATSDARGDFQIEPLADGMYDLVIEAPGFMQTRVNVTVNDGYMKNMFNLSLSPTVSVKEVDDASFADIDFDGLGYDDTPTILYGQNDVFNNAASYNFSSVRFRARGYASETQDVYLAGVKMNDAMTGYTPYSLWSGLNEIVRSKDATLGSEISDYGVGGYNGLVNIFATPSKVRPGRRFSLLTNSAFYRLRLMGTCAVPENDKGWSWSVSASARLGGNDWVQGVYYRSFAYYAGVEKNWNDVHRLALVSFAAPGIRGAQNGSTQEVYDLMGDNMYNSNWGYQNGKVRNARNRITFEPVTFLKYDFTPSHVFSADATVLFRGGKNGYTALDWYDAPDPRPDYYRNLPSYFYMENPDFKRRNFAKYMWAREAWETHDPSTAHINWDRLYDVNRRNAQEQGNRSKYVLEERRTDQRDLNFAANLKWQPANHWTVRAGLNAKINRTEYYKLMNDLLGGDYFLNIDQFAERDFSSSETMIQNDLDYFLRHGNAQQIRQGDKYGYDYYAHIHKQEVWSSVGYGKGGFLAILGGRIGHTGFWREGRLRKGLFPGLDADGQPISYQGNVITTYDPDGKPITSFGNSEKTNFLTFGGKLNLGYSLRGGHRIFADLGYSSDAPFFDKAFVAPRTRNTLMKNLTNVKSFSSDLNYVYSNNGCNLRLTGYYTTIQDQTDVMSVYYDLQNSFGNFAMSGIDERHAGMELGFEVPTPLKGLSLVGAFTWGDHVYTSNPRMTATVDNNADLINDNILVPYWMSHPEDGKTVKHYVAGTPQLAGSLGLSYFYKYWFIDADVDYFAKSYLDMSPIRRTDLATAGPDGQVTPEEIVSMASQEEFDPVFLINFSVGKSWYLHRKYQLGFSLNVKNILNNRQVKTGGYEQTRMVDNTVSKTRYYNFDPKYFYMPGFNYMLNLYFRF